MKNIYQYTATKAFRNQLIGMIKAREKRLKRKLTRQERQGILDFLKRKIHDREMGIDHVKAKPESWINSEQKNGTVGETVLIKRRLTM
jgi:hypothetical protein